MNSAFEEVDLTKIIFDKEYTPSFWSANRDILRAYACVPPFHWSPLFSLRLMSKSYVWLFGSDVFASQASIIGSAGGVPWSWVFPSMSVILTSSTLGAGVSDASWTLTFTWMTLSSALDISNGVVFVPHSSSVDDALVYTQIAGVNVIEESVSARSIGALIMKFAGLSPVLERRMFRAYALGGRLTVSN